jgi:hypothetical protein
VPTQDEASSNLRRDASSLRTEALQLVRNIGLLAVLEEAFGAAALVGSVDLDLMTWRDIDVYAPVECSDKAAFLNAVTAIAAQIAAAGHEIIGAVFNDEWVQPRGDYGRGYYWGLRVRTGAGETWKVDLWGWDRETFANKMAQHGELKRALAKCDRDLILKLKSEAMQLPEFRKTVTSWDVYQRVLGGA